VSSQISIGTYWRNVILDDGKVVRTTWKAKAL